jgi:putative DNA primase/helicase
VTETIQAGSLNGQATGAPTPAELAEEVERDQGFPQAHDHWARKHAAGPAFAAKFKHVPGIGWCQWDGMIWAVNSGEDHDNEILRQHMDAVQGMYHSDLPHIPETQRPGMLRALVSAANVPFAKNTLKAMAAMPVFHVDASAFDADTSILVTPKGVVNCESPWPLLPHDSSRLVMRCTRGSLGPGKKEGTRWAQFMAEVFPDPEMCAFMRRLLGYIVFGHRNEHIFPIFTGDGGNGKSVMVEALGWAMGEYASTAPAELLLWSKNDRHSEEKMVLFGRRLVAASELPEGRRLNEALVKQITGSANMSARELYSKRITFTRTWVPTLDTNHMPLINGTEDAIWDRVLKIPFEQRFRGTDREEKGLVAKLQDDPDAVISWCGEGWRDYRENGGLRLPEAVKAATAQYREGQDTLGAFIAEALQSSIPSEPLSEVKERYVRHSGVLGMSSRKMRDLLEARGSQVRAGSRNVTTVHWWDCGWAPG